MLLARRNLFRDRTRFLLSVLGVAVSVGLILLLSGYRAGVYRQASAYLDNTPGTVVVAEKGIRDFLGTSSGPARRRPRGRPGRHPASDRVIPVVSQFVIFERHGRKDGFFLIGYDPVLGGGPWKLVEGREPAADDELVIDRTTARQHDVAIGDRSRLLDRDATVVGLSDETTFWAGSIAFARISTPRVARSGTRPAELPSSSPRAAPARRSPDRSAVPGTEVLLKGDVVANDAKLLARVYDAPIGLMVAIAFFVGVLVVGLVIYTATIERRREYGAIKAIGARNRTLYRVVTIQAFIAAAIGAIAGVGLAYGGGAALMAWRPQFRVEIEPAACRRVVIASLVMALLAALIPARSVARLEPAEVFRG